MVKEVLPIFLAGRGLDNPLIWLGAIGSAIAIIWLSYFLIRQLINAISNSKNLKISYTILFVISLLSLWIYPSQSNKSTIQWTIPKVIQSASTEGFNKFQLIEKQSTYENYFQNDLVYKPNIYLIVVEAYGSVVSLSPELKPSYEQLVNGLGKKLQINGWHSTSNYSNSTIQGGRSWLAFSSLMTGLSVESQINYNDLLYKNQNFPHLIRYLNNQQYRTYRITTLSATEAAKKKIPQKAMQQFWEFDKWLQFDDIPYRGYVYNNFGGIPDQYALGYFNNTFTKQNASPEFLFFITMSSHAPWQSPPKIVEDWKALDTIASHQDNTPNDILRKYKNTIQYELEFLTQFITETADSNSIFMLVGDHQPAGLRHHLPEDINPFSCPIHLISRDSNFISAFENYGFKNGLLPNYNNETTIHHAGVYSMFMQQLITHYGAPNSAPPEYLPKGLK